MMKMFETPLKTTPEYIETVRKVMISLLAISSRAARAVGAKVIMLR